jgi:hypothetical protein
MTDIDTIARDRLDRRYPALAGEPDWADVLERLGRAAPPRRNRGRYGFALIAAALVAVVAVALVGIRRGSPSFVDQALAAVGNGRYVHAVLDTPTSDQMLDLATGDTRIVSLRAEVRYDTSNGAWDSWVIRDGIYFAPTQPPPADPTIAAFASGYAEALASGKAKVVGSTTVSGERATIIRFPIAHTGGLVDEEVAVSDASHAPLWIRGRFAVVENGHVVARHLSGTTRVLSISSSDEVSDPAGVIKLAPPVTGWAQNLRRVEPSVAPKAFGHTALWVGSTIGGLRLQDVRLQRLASVIGPDSRDHSNALGLKVAYRQGGRSLQIRQAASPEAGYGFGVGIEGVPPAPGAASLSCGPCPGEKSRRGTIWRAFLRQDDLFVGIRSASRDLVIRAARSLVPMP